MYRETFRDLGVDLDGHITLKKVSVRMRDGGPLSTPRSFALFLMLVYPHLPDLVHGRQVEPSYGVHFCGSAPKAVDLYTERSRMRGT